MGALKNITSRGSAVVRSRDTSQDLSQGAELIGALLQSRDYNDVLSMVAGEIAKLIEASGVAIAVREDDVSPVVCRANWGLAPDLGVTVHEAAGLCGECLRTAALVRCDDSTVDPRVGGGSAVRSILAVPIGRVPRPNGLVVAFGTKPHAFNEAHADLLTFVADVLATSVERTRPPDLPSLPPPRPRATTVQRTPLKPGGVPKPTLAAPPTTTAPDAAGRHKSPVVAPTQAPGSKPPEASRVEPQAAGPKTVSTAEAPVVSQKTAVAAEPVLATTASAVATAPPVISRPAAAKITAVVPTPASAPAAAVGQLPRVRSVVDTALEFPTLTSYETRSWAAALRRISQSYREEIRLALVVLIANVAVAAFIMLADQRNSPSVPKHAVTETSGAPSAQTGHDLHSKTTTQ